ncbi:MAG: hypothetical protein C0624_14060 [Desulfuromonas sp.]|nr:MAG: hypothetical protein C0624_14060 [Desulfuromonas sp.]
MMKKSLLLLALMILLPSFAMAKPDGATAKSVLDYYLTGSEVVLLEHNFCSSIQDTECINPLDPQTVANGAEAFLWMNFMVPKPVVSNLFIQFQRKGRTLLTSEVTMKDSIGYRTWIPLPTDKSGAWKVVVEQEKSQGYEGVTTLDYTVN